MTRSLPASSATKADPILKFATLPIHYGRLDDTVGNYSEPRLGLVPIV
jgi:hypothetical protein